MGGGRSRGGRQICEREVRVEKRKMSDLIKREEKEGEERGKGKNARGVCKRVSSLVPRLGMKLVRSDPCYSEVGEWMNWELMPPGVHCLLSGSPHAPGCTIFG